MFLILAARAAYVRNLVRPALERGAWVLSDRFELSTFAYQGYGRGFDLTALASLNRVATDGCTPDLHLVLDMPVETGMERQRSQGKSADRIESEGVEFFMAVRRGYVELAETWESAELISAAGSTEEVAQRIGAVVQERFPETFGATGV